jgi:hypothetical protein
LAHLGGSLMLMKKYKLLIDYKKNKPKAKGFLYPQKRA